MEQDIERILFSAKEITARVREIAKEINCDYVGRTPLLIGILRGSFVFMADLIREITLPCTIDFMSVSSYGNGTVSSGTIQITKDLSEDIKGKDLILVEDILDSGNTLHYLIEKLSTHHPSSIRICTLLDKPSRRKIPIYANYCGFEIPDEFVVGYGLDYAEQYRNLSYIGVLKPSVYAD